jgi:hypothetical protein
MFHDARLHETVEITFLDFGKISQLFKEVFEESIESQKSQTSPARPGRTIWRCALL